MLARPREHTDDDFRWYPFRAKIDTGASISGISSNVANDLRLTSVGNIPVRTAGGLIFAPTFRVCVALRINRHTNSTPQNADVNWLTRVVTASLIHADQNSSRDMLLGMDFLQHCHLSMYKDSFFLSN